MCRHLGYLGAPRSVHDLVYGPPHSLQVQAYAPRMSEACLLNADGFGVGWYPAPDRPDGHGPGGATAPRPVRYRRAQPIWTDVSFADVAKVVRAASMVAAVRSATIGFPADESCAQPFRAGRWLFSHNGRVEGFPGVEARLRELAHAALTGPGGTAPVTGDTVIADAAEGTVATGVAAAGPVTTDADGTAAGSPAAAPGAAVTAGADGTYGASGADGARSADGTGGTGPAATSAVTPASASVPATTPTATPASAAADGGAMTRSGTGPVTGPTTGPVPGPVPGWAGVPDARAPVDSALLFALAVGRWRAGAALGDGLAEVVATAAELAPSRLNLLAGDGTRLAATAYGDTLFARDTGAGYVIASEPYDDDPGWERVPDRSLVTADAAAGLRIRPL